MSTTESNQAPSTHSITDHVKTLWWSAPLWMRVTLIIALLWAIYKYFSLVGLLDFLLFAFLLCGTIFAIAGVSGESLAGMQEKVDGIVEEIKRRVTEEIARQAEETILEEEAPLQEPEQQPEEV
ncbi:MAG: hypothetical protein P8N24_01385 [Hellea sp.]|nr:hypothetical protein [Hellea sp.]